MVYDLVEQGIGVVWSTAYLDEAERCAVGAHCSTRAGSSTHGPPEELTARADGPVLPASAARASRRQVLAAARLSRPEVDRRRDPGRERPAGRRRGRAAARRRRRSACAGAAESVADAAAVRGRLRRPARRRPEGRLACWPEHRERVRAEDGAVGRGRRADQAVRHLHRRRPHHLPDPPGRDLRPARPQRGRQVDDVQDALRAAAADRGHGAAWPASTSTAPAARPARGSATWPRSSRSTAT